jgi:predicted dehydrogenase
VIEATTASFPGSAERIDLIGTKGTAAITGTELEVRWIDGQYEHRAADDFAGGIGADPMAFSHRYHFAAWNDFLDAVDNARSPRASAREALRVHYVIDAMLESAANDGAPIVVRNKFVAQPAS